MTTSRQQRLRQVAANRQRGLTVVLENIWDPHNVAAILRSCDAVGIQVIHLVYTRDKFPGIGAKAAAGVKKWLQIERHATIAACYRVLRRAGYHILASTLAGKPTGLYRLKLRRPTALVFSNEHRGASDDAARLADGTFRIPQVGFAQSLNVSVAAAVTLYEAFRQRQRTPTRLSVRERERLLRAWRKLA
ncbi:MAG: RNA methyltransferase [bacterium]|nr:RNA methyltransferase [bacterium]